MAKLAGELAYYKGDIVTFTVASGKTIKKGNVVSITGNWEISPSIITTPYSSNPTLIGVAMNDGSEGEKVEVLLNAPIVYVVACGDIVAGNALGPYNVAGAVKAIGTEGEFYCYIIGYAIEGASDGETFAMMLIHAVCYRSGM